MKETLLSKHSDTTLQLLEKILSYSLNSSITPKYDAYFLIEYYNPYSTLRTGLHDKFLILTPLFTPTWFSDDYISFLDTHVSILHKV